MYKAAYLSRLDNNQQWQSQVYLAVNADTHSLSSYQIKPTVSIDWTLPDRVLDLTICKTYTTDENDEHGKGKGTSLDTVFGRSHVFQVRSFREIWTLSAESEVEMEEWLQAIDLACSLGQMVDDIEADIKSAVKYHEVDMQELSRLAASQPPSAAALLFSALPPSSRPNTATRTNTNDPDRLIRRTSALLIATDSMLHSAEVAESASRDKLEEVTNSKWEAKCKLQELEKHASLQLEENKSALMQLQLLDGQLRSQLAEINEHVASLEKFIRASNRLQQEATAAFAVNRNNIMAAAFMLCRRYAESRSPSAQAYISTLIKHFHCSDESRLAEGEGRFSAFDVMCFFADYWDNVHLPRDLELRVRREGKLKVWRQLVQCVSDTQHTQKAIDEVELVLGQLKIALAPPVANPVLDALNFPQPSTSHTRSMTQTMTQNLKSSAQSRHGSFSVANNHSSANRPSPADLPSASASVQAANVLYTPQGSDAESVQFAIENGIYREFWEEVVHAIADLRFYRLQEAILRKELEIALTSRESLHLLQQQKHQIHSQPA